MVFPLYDDNPFKRARVPYVTWGLLIVNVVIFLFEVGYPDDAAKALVASYGATPAAITHQALGGSLPPELTLISYMFLHGGWEHVLGNMIYLWVFGDDIEDALGPVRFIAFYLLTGIGSAIFYTLINRTSTVPLIGASGAISGILAAYLMLRPCAKVSVFVLRMVVRIRAYWVIGGWVVLQLYQIASQASDGVAYVAHGGGLIAGAILFLIMKPSDVRLFECIEQPGEEAAAS